MNNPKSMALGWGVLVAGAGISFYFAKKSINERRYQQEVSGSRPTEKLDWQAKIAREVEAQAGQASTTSPTAIDGAGSVGSIPPNSTRQTPLDSPTKGP